MSTTRRVSRWWFTAACLSTALAFAPHGAAQDQPAAAAVEESEQGGPAHAAGEEISSDPLATEQPASSDADAAPAQPDDDVPLTDSEAGADVDADQPLEGVPPPDAPAGAQDPLGLEGEPQPAANNGPGGTAWYVLAAVVLATITVPFLIGNYLSTRLRMPDHAWKIGTALATITAAAVITAFGWPPQLGPDLSGGVNLIYELDRESLREAGDDESVDMEKMIAAISQRVNPGGVKEVTIRQYGPDQVEIIIPRADDVEIDLIKRKISTSGALEFRITANNNDHAEIIALARQQREQGHRRIMQDGTETARWIRLNEREFDPQRDQHLITSQNRRGEWEVLIVMDPYNVTGNLLLTATRGVDRRGQPAVDFVFNAEGARRFGRLTGENTPIEATNFYRYLGIVLDDELRSAPRIEDAIYQRGQISGNFTLEEVDFIISILNAGSLPAALNKQPISQREISATLGADTVRKGFRAIAISFVAVLCFMLVYYRFAGVVACVALMSNLVLILGVMISIKAAFTLPGLAGLVLTVGMAVDANVLIFERIREELSRGAALRMAIRNGFDRATRTIVDANITTLITAVVLYWIGTDQIRGFAVTLILGIIMSMYTAIFCSRIVFDIFEKQRWLTRLKMMRLFGQTDFDFLGRRRIAFACSLVVIVLGLAAVVQRGLNILDIDFTGGTAVTVLFQEDQPLPIADVRRAVDSQPGLEDVAVIGIGDDQLRYTIHTTNKDIDVVEQRIEEIFGDRLQTNSLEYEVLARAGADAPPEANEATSDQAGDTTASLRLGEALKGETLQELIRTTQQAVGAPDAAFEISNPDYVPGSDQRFDAWELKIALDKDMARTVLDKLNQQLAATPVFPSSSNIGGKVAGDTQAQAGYALFASLFFIVGYIWMRFQRIAFGLAAVVALVHDVLVTLGMIAISAYIVNLAGPLASVLLLDPFKISLPVVAAFLTIIGYSLNDTIVVFDRIREVRGKSPDLTPDMINTSINQTLGRTILTSLTTLLVVVILYVLGGAGIHGFAYALVVGVVVGTYSSVFIASPVLLAMHRPPGSWPSARHGRPAPVSASR